MDQQEDDLLSTNQAAQLAGVSYHAVYLAAKLGRIPHQISIDPARRASGGGPMLLFRRDAIEAYIAQRTARRNRPRLTNAERQRRKYQRKRHQSRETVQPD